MPPMSVTDFGAHVPEDKAQYRIRTPYGEGLTLRTRPATGAAPQMRQIELVDWKNARDASTSDVGFVKPAFLYSTADFPSVSPQVDDEVVCLYGRGKVTEIRVASTTDENGRSTTSTTLVVLISDWRLAHRSRVTCYLQPAAVRVVRAKKLYEMSVYERVEAGQNFKEEAATQFSAKEYKEALRSYAKAIDAVRYVQHKKDSSNSVRADLLVMMITCTNNAATCSRQLGHWDEALNFAKNAQVLIDALERQKGKKIHGILVKDGYSDIKCFGEWKVKSLLLQARALAEKQETMEVFSLLKQAHEAIQGYTIAPYTEDSPASVTRLRSLAKEVKKLHTACKERRSLQLKKEKQRAAAMFGGGKASKTVAPKAAPANLGQEAMPEKENEQPNGSSNPTPVAGTTLPLKDSNDFAPPAENEKIPAKRRVSFSEKVTAYEIPNKSGDAGGNDDDEVEWYKDTEVLVGLGIFGGAIVASSLLVSFLMRKR
jgi:ribosomal protein L14